MIIKKVFCLNKTKELNIQDFVQENSDMIKIHKFDFRTMEELSWI